MPAWRTRTKIAKALVDAGVAYEDQKVDIVDMAVETIQRGFYRFYVSVIFYDISYSVIRQHI